MATGKRTKKSGQLTNKQAAFVQEYLKDNNATQAAIRAGFAASTADKQVYMWVGKNRDDCPVKYQHIWDAVQAAMAERQERLQIDADWILKELVKLYQIDISRLFVDGQLKPLDAMTDDERKLLSTYASNTGLKLFDKTKLLEMIGQHIQVSAFKQNVEVSGKIDVADAILKSAKCKRKTLIAGAKDDQGD